MHEADNAYSIRSTWSCYWLDQFLTLALNILILSIFYISMDLSTNYFAHFSGCWASFACSCHYPRMLCHVFWSQVEYKIVCFISWVHEFMSSWVHEFMSSWVHDFMSSRLHEFEFMSSQLHDFKTSGLYDFTTSQLHNFTTSRLHDFTTSRGHEVTRSRVHEFISS